MKTIGLLGGMSWKSTTEYYRIINEEVKSRPGGLHSAQIILYSVDFDYIERMQHLGNWKSATSILVEAAHSIQSAGADFLLICTNTMHKVADEIEQSIDIPLLHIADATADVMLSDGIKIAGLLGTAFTMEEHFYKGRLQSKFGLDVRIPESADRKIAHKIIYEELCLGKTKPESRKEYLRIIEQLTVDGAEVVILGCTEIGMLVRQKDTQIPLLDTTYIHAVKAVELALADTNN